MKIGGLMSIQPLSQPRADIFNSCIQSSFILFLVAWGYLMCCSRSFFNSKYIHREYLSAPINVSHWCMLAILS